MAELNCPKCSSDNTQKLSAIVDGGTSHSRSQSVGSVGGSFGGRAGFGMTSSTTNTQTQTTLAKKLSAPRKKATVLLLIGFFFLICFVWAILPKFVGLLGALALGYYAFTRFKKNSAYNTDVWPGLFKTWEESFYCHRCENVFVPNWFPAKVEAPLQGI